MNHIFTFTPPPPGAERQVVRGRMRALTPAPHLRPAVCRAFDLCFTFLPPCVFPFCHSSFSALAHFIPPVLAQSAVPGTLSLRRRTSTMAAARRRPQPHEMPYLGGAYSGLSAVHNVDYFRNNDEPSADEYRAGESPNVPHDRQPRHGPRRLERHRELAARLGRRRQLAQLHAHLPDRPLQGLCPLLRRRRSGNRCQGSLSA